MSCDHLTPVLSGILYLIITDKLPMSNCYIENIISYYMPNISSCISFNHQDLILSFFLIKTTSVFPFCNMRLCITLTSSLIHCPWDYKLAWFSSKVVYEYVLKLKSIHPPEHPLLGSLKKILEMCITFYA